MSEALAWPTGQPTREPSPERNLTILMDVLIAAEVDLGTYDQRIVEWLTRWEPQTVVVIAGLIWRARSRDQQASEPESPDAE
jgi:hypothetical protein